MTLNLNQLDPYTPTRKRRHAVDEEGKQLSTGQFFQPLLVPRTAEGAEGQVPEGLAIVCDKAWNFKIFFLFCYQMNLS